MLTLSKRTDYALISLAFVAGREGLVASARQIASAADLPLPLLMQILKTLHQHGVLQSTRGVKGGYSLQPGVESLSLLALIRMLDGETSAITPENGNAQHPPLRAMHQKLMQFLEQVKVFDVIRPGRRIDVPVEAVGFLDRIKGPVRLGLPRPLRPSTEPVVCKEELLTTGSAGLI